MRTTAPSAQRADGVLCGLSPCSPPDLMRALRAPRDYKDKATTVRNNSRRRGAVSMEKRVDQRRGVDRAASWPRRQPHQARSAQCVLCGRSAGSLSDLARPCRAPHNQKKADATVPSRSRRQCAVYARRSIGQRRGVEHATGLPRTQPHQVGSVQRECSVGGRLVLDRT